MKRNNITDKPVTEGKLQEILTNVIKALGLEIDYKINTAKEDTDEKAREYRDQLMDKLDHIVGELADMREDRIVGDHQTKKVQQIVDNHEKRITKLEHRN